MDYKNKNIKEKILTQSTKTRYTFIENMFQNVFEKYDLMNDIMSFTMHRKWKNKLTSFVSLMNPKKVMDLGAGTCDLSISFIDNHPSYDQITILDPSKEMLDFGKKKLIDQVKYDSEKIKFVVAYAEDLPIESGGHDVVMSSFALRNFNNIEKSLNEVNRVLTDEGVFVCMEFSNQASNYFAQKFYNQYKKLIPKVGKMVAGKESYYEYLIDSIDSFTSEESFVELLKKCGFNRTEVVNVGYVCKMYICFK